MTTIQRLGLWTLVTLTLSGVGCSKTIPVGALISESGAAAFYGESVRKGIELAVEEVNAEGGFQGKTLEVVFRDDGTLAEMGIDAVNELIDQHGAKFIIGAVSSPVTLAVAPVCEQKKVLLLSPTASAPAISDAGNYVFRNYPSDILEGTAMANFARDVGLENLVIFAADNEFGAGLKEVFTEEYLGRSKFRKILATYDFPEGEASSLAIDELKELQPDGIYIAGYVSDVSAIIRAVRQAGLDAVILTTSSVTASGLASIAGPAAENVVFPRSSTFDAESDDEAVQDFIAAFRAKFHEEPDHFAAHGYDSVKLLLEAMRLNESAHPDNVKLAMSHIKNFPGAAGKITFDNDGDVVLYPRLFVMRQGRAIPYDRFIQEGGTL